MLTPRNAIGFLAIAALAAGLHFGPAHTSATQQSTNIVVRVSGDDPYANCPLTIAPGEVNFPNTRVEPYVAVNPLNGNLIGVWQQDRWNDGGARGIVAAFSSDSGNTWGQTSLPLSQCAPGGLAEERASDPWVSIGPDGTAYASAISFSLNSATPDTSVTTVTSADGGKTWQNLSVIEQDPLSLALNDNESVTADPTIPGTAYVVWDQIVFSQINASAWFAVTHDGGVTWSPGRVIYSSARRQFVGGSQLVVDPNTHALYDFFEWEPPRSNLSFLAFVKSTDGGATWSSVHPFVQLMSLAISGGVPPQLIRTQDNEAAEILAALQARGVNFAASEVPIRGGSEEGVAIDPHTGQIYIVWNDARFSGMLYDEIAITTSTDGGATWSAPARVNRSTGRVEFGPSVRVSQQGVVAVTYYDFRSFSGQPNVLPTDYWIIFSHDGSATFQKETHVAGPFNILAAPFIPGDGFMLGDYYGLGWLNNAFAFAPFFVQTNCLDNSCAAISGGQRPTDVFTTRIAP